MIKNFSILLSILCFSLVAKSQATEEYLDIQEQITEKKFAYFTRIRTADSLGYTCFEMRYLNGKLYFEGCVSKLDSKGSKGNVYVGACRWYHRNGQLKTTAVFNAEGKLHGLFAEYSDEGTELKRSEYKDGTAIATEDDKLAEDKKEVKHTYVDAFDDNKNDWDLFVSEKHSAVIEGGLLTLTSNTDMGVGRYIKNPMQSAFFEIELTIAAPTKKKAAAAKGIIYDFKDWSNYRYFFFYFYYFSIGLVRKGQQKKLADLLSSVHISANANVLSIHNKIDRCNFLINNKVVFRAKSIQPEFDKIGVVVGGKGSAQFDKLSIIEDLSRPAAFLTDESVKGTGSGFLINTSGYLITNYHVIEKANRIFVELPELNATFEAKEVISDKTNDLALLQIVDTAFRFTEEIVYGFSTKMEDVGAEAFTLGYPFVLSGLGREVKFADGKISSRTGYDNEVALYQTTVPIQPGNSGSPLFNSKAEVVGCVNAIFRNADNVSYAI
ncbi:MAG: trypsin-like peptidase domain-containing protein, partial [Flavobacteriales bacterium]|nr:trypsin-like peptidase domain-containing protein [Flavobacteriales bacterium]